MYEYVNVACWLDYGGELRTKIEHIGLEDPHHIHLWDNCFQSIH